MSNPLTDIARSTREACRRAALDAHEDALIRGLCAQGAFEAAMCAIQSLDLAPLLEPHTKSTQTTSPLASLKTKRIYEPAADSDGIRILVDRLWPRAVSRYHAQLHGWAKDAAPSPKLRRWFNHDPQRWEEFQRRYHQELDSRPHALDEIRALMPRHHVTLVYAAKDQSFNNAVALQTYLTRGQSPLLTP
jgi:uncharacterized protein YeaO (DUF488 family)